ncbi:inositol monophosphatase [Prolixibacteraceae bacterium JC049]|nr:inositol monophosphatase [Prolixibacteraceae bacterium JC049]
MAFQNLCNIATEAALEAGKLIQQHASTNDIKVEHKEYGSSIASQVVTQVDRLSQDVILKYILPTCEKYNLGLLTEESTDDNSRFQKEYFWCIDPIDGTLPFIKQTAGYSVSIGLVAKDGTPIMGLIYDPIEENLYHAIKDEGAFFNKKPMRLPELENLSSKPFTWVCDPGFEKHPKYAIIKDAIQQLANNWGYSEFKTIELGGAAMNGIWTIEHAPACYFKLPKPEAGGGSLWDFAATAAILSELGASATNMHLQKLDLNRKDSTYMNHQGALYASHKEMGKALSKVLLEINS